MSSRMLATIVYMRWSNAMLIAGDRRGITTAMHYLAMEDIIRRWTMRQPHWGQILLQLAILLHGRVPETN